MSISVFRETLSEALTVGIKTHNRSKDREQVTMEHLVLTGTSVYITHLLKVQEILQQRGQGDSESHSLISSAVKQYLLK